MNTGLTTSRKFHAKKAKRVCISPQKGTFQDTEFEITTAGEHSTINKHINVYRES